MSTDTPRPARHRRSRARYLAAGAYDLATLLGACALAVVLVTAWLLARTEAGRLDVGGRDAFAMTALLAAVPAAWTAWQLAHLRTHGTSAGGRRLALGPRTTPRRLLLRVLRAAVDPLVAPGWAWLAAGTWLLGVPVVPLVAVALAVAGLLWGLVTLALLLARGPSGERS